MREIKFRFYDKVKEEYIFYTLDEIITFVITYDEDCELWGEEVVEQYTGLKDKNGVEIYEGDYYIDEDGMKLTVKWDKYTASFILLQEDELDGWSHKEQFYFMTPLNKWFEVIGNIHKGV